MTYPAALKAHLATGATTLCRCWSLARRDGVVLGFTDHDRPISFDGLTFRADTGMTARAVEMSTGLSVDNSEVMGALSDPSVREEDIEAGRFDGAEVQSWLVNWQSPDQRALLFKGSIGEITRAGGAFQAELRGLAERLNQPRGRVYQTGCTAVLGDGTCGFDLSAPGYRLEGPVIEVETGRTITLADPGGFAEAWFVRGVVEVLDGAAAGLKGLVKTDLALGASRQVELWETFRAPIVAGDTVRVTAGCDKQAATCRDKFANFVNFRGFPNIPGEDWLLSYPTSRGLNNGGSLGT